MKRMISLLLALTLLTACAAPAKAPSSYTSCRSPEETMEAVNLDFDGNTDFGLFGWSPNNTIPYFYWTWDAEMERYRFSFILQGAEVHPEAKQLSAEVYEVSAGNTVSRFTEIWELRDGEMQLTNREEYTDEH